MELTTTRPDPQIGPLHAQLITNILKLHECEKEFCQITGIIAQSDPETDYSLQEGQYCTGIDNCMSVAGFFIGKNTIREIRTHRSESEIPDHPGSIRF